MIGVYSNESKIEEIIFESKNDSSIWCSLSERETIIREYKLLCLHALVECLDLSDQEIGRILCDDDYTVLINNMQLILENKISKIFDKYLIFL